MMQIHCSNYPRIEAENKEYWARMGGTPALHAMRVLDFGCGLGRLSVDLAEAGADDVLGVDIDESAINFARVHTREQFPDLSSRISFVRADVRSLPDGKFDAVFSKDAFEHIVNLDSLFTEICRKVRPGGKLYLGFGPLWYSPFGAHGIARRIRTVFGYTIPWAHLVIPEQLLVSVENRDKGTNIHSIREYGLNQLAFESYRQIILGSGLKVLRFETNPSDNHLARVLRPAERIPFVRKYFIRTVYCILEKP